MRARLMVVATLVLGLVSGLPATASSDTYRVRAMGSSPSDFHWMPSYRHVVTGDRVRWTNPTGSRHKVVAYRGPWDKNTTIEPGETTSKRFTRTGTYKYRCTIRNHSTLSDGRCEGMCGTVHVAN